MRAMSGLMKLNPDGDWQDQARRLLDLLMDGLRAGPRLTTTPDPPRHSDRGATEGQPGASGRQ
jgi:hypothetical protein